MIHINTRQIDNHCWKIQVTDGYQTIWNASFGGSQNNLMVIRYGEKDHGEIHGKVDLIGNNESQMIGDAVSLVYNWVQSSNQCTEPLNERWCCSK